MGNGFWTMLGWVIAASGVGFGISAVFAGRMNLSRHSFLIPYVSLVSIFLCAFFLLSEVDLPAILAKNVVWGILTGGVVSLFLVKTVRSQPLSRNTYGVELALDMTWAGLVYGIVDSLFLNVMPVIAIWIGGSQFAWSSTVAGKIGLALLGLVASLLVTLTYHLGYQEFRNKSVMLVLMGNSLITLAYLLSGNPLGSLISHTAMHVAAVLQGPETTIQLPPHYQVQQCNIRKKVPNFE
jgi:hypothetical protein